MPDDLIGIGKAVEGINQLTKEFRELIKSFAGPSAKEIGELLADKIRYRRLKNLVPILQKAHRLLRNHGIDPQEVNLKLLFPILQEASLEEEDELVQKWAGLLASAAAGNRVRSSYPKILSELTCTDAKMLDLMFLRYDEKKPYDKQDWSTIQEMKKVANLSEEEALIAITNISRLGLSNIPSGLSDALAMSDIVEYRIKLTPLGYDFVRACEGPL